MRTLVLLIFLTSTLSTQAQTGVYHPFPDSNAVWCCEWSVLGACGPFYYPIVSINATYQLNGSTIIDGKIYNRLNEYELRINMLCNQDTSIGTTTYYIRQDTAIRKVWIYDNTSKADTVLYDFNLHVGDTLDRSKVYWNAPYFIYTVTLIDSVLIDGSYRKRFHFDSADCGCFGDCSIIEGVGSMQGLFYQPSCFEYGASLHEFIQNSKVLIGDSSVVYHFCQNYLLNANEIKDKLYTTVSPNPFHTTATLEIKTKEFSNVELKIYDRMGRLVQRQIINSPSAIIHRNSLADGIYFYQLVSGDGQVVSGKFVVE